MKPIRQLPVGELHPLPIPDSRCDTISVDFIVELPQSNGYDVVMTVVDSVSKRAHFVPTHTTVMAEGTARLFLHNIWKLHGLLLRWYLIVVPNLWQSSLGSCTDC